MLFDAEKNRTGYVYAEAHNLHRCPWDDLHPENASRLTSLYESFVDLGLASRCRRVKGRMATSEELRLKHDLSYIQQVEASSHMNLDQLKILSQRYDGVYFCRGTFEAAATSVGCQIELLNAIHEGEILNGIALTRPPNHHALKSHASGYCIFNGIAISIQHALKSLNYKRIALIDWDIHHGQGSQHAFYGDPRVLVISMHRYDDGSFWPNLRAGDYDFIGEGSGLGFNVNVPINSKANASNDLYLHVFMRIIIPMLSQFSPELIFISHGSDSTIGDPEGGCTTTPGLFAHCTSMLQGIQPRILVSMEGGYNQITLNESTFNIVRTLLADPLPILPKHKPINNFVVLELLRLLRPIWTSLRMQENTMEAGEYNHATMKTRVRGDEQDYEHYLPGDFDGPFQIVGDYPMLSETQNLQFRETLEIVIRSETTSEATNKLAIVYDESMEKHNREGHPENAERITRIFDLLKLNGILEEAKLLKTRIATDEEIMLVHSKSHLKFLKSLTCMDDLQLQIEQIGMDSVYLTKDIYECVGIAAGCMLALVDEIVEMKSQAGFAIIRPPGHHAYSDTASGFCFVNNVAVAAQYALKHYGNKPVGAVKRVLIFDWDVHHGNGTQDIFYDDPNVLYISVHRGGPCFYPASGANSITNTGSGEGDGFNVNIAWEKSTPSELNDVAYLEAVRQIVVPIAYEFAPDLVLISAGFDAGVADPLGGCMISYQGFGLMTHELKKLAGGKLILALEGGYNLRTNSEASYYCCCSLLGDTNFLDNGGRDPGSDICSNVMNDLAAVVDVQRKYWNCFTKEVKMPHDIDTMTWLGEFSAIESMSEQLKDMEISDSTEEIDSNIETINILSENDRNIEVDQHEISSVIENNLEIESQKETSDESTLFQNNEGIISPKSTPTQEKEKMYSQKEIKDESTEKEINKYDLNKELTNKLILIKNEDTEYMKSPTESTQESIIDKNDYIHLHKKTKDEDTKSNINYEQHLINETTTKPIIVNKNEDSDSKSEIKQLNNLSFKDGKPDSLNLTENKSTVEDHNKLINSKNERGDNPELYLNTVQSNISLKNEKSTSPIPDLTSHSNSTC